MKWVSNPVEYFFMVFMVLIGLACYGMGNHGSAFAIWTLAICTTIMTKK